MKNKGGRPTKLTPELVTKLEYVFSIGGSISEACMYADISRETFYRWKEENPELYDRFETLREKPVLMARETVMRSLDVNSEDRDPKIAMDYLKNKKSDEFATRSESKQEIKQTILDEETKKEIEEAFDESKLKEE